MVYYLSAVLLSAVLLLKFLHTSFATNATNGFTYVKSESGMSANDFTLTSAVFSCLEECLLHCEQGSSAMSVEFAESTGLCVCHSAQPAALTLIPTPDTNIFVNRGNYILLNVVL